MAANHPCCNTRLVRHHREWFKKNAPDEWKSVYGNLKKVYDGPHNGGSEDWNRHSSTCATFIWERQLQGARYWMDIDDRMFNH